MIGRRFLGKEIHLEILSVSEKGVVGKQTVLNRVRQDPPGFCLTLKFCLKKTDDSRPFSA